MSAITRSKPSFIIYRDEPEVSTSSEQSTTTATASTPVDPVTSPRPTLTISTSFSINDKENSAPYPTATGEKVKANKTTKPKTGLVTKSAPTSPHPIERSQSMSSIRSALATKFVAVPTSSSSNTIKSKSQSSTLKRSASSHTSISGSSTSENARPRVKRSASSTGVVARKHHKSRVVGLTSVAESVEETSVFGPDGLTTADRRAKELTQLPLADISVAFPTSAAPAPSSPSRKRNRAQTIVTREESEPSSSQTLSEASQGSTAIMTPSEPEVPAETSSCPSPSKRVRLSPVRNEAPLLPIRAEATLVEDVFEAPNEEPTLVDLFSPSS